MLCILGFADSGYQVYTHFTGTGLAGCSASTDACVLDQNSVYAWVFGIPGRRLRRRVLGLHGRDLLTTGVEIGAAPRPSGPDRRCGHRDDFCALPDLPGADQPGAHLRVLHQRARHHLPVVRAARV